MQERCLSFRPEMSPESHMLKVWSPASGLLGGGRHCGQQGLVGGSSSLKGGTLTIYPLVSHAFFASWPPGSDQLCSAMTFHHGVLPCHVPTAMDSPTKAWSLCYLESKPFLRSVDSCSCHLTAMKLWLTQVLRHACVMARQRLDRKYLQNIKGPIAAHLISTPVFI